MTQISTAQKWLWTTDSYEMKHKIRVISRSGLKENTRDKTRQHNVPSVGLIDRPMAPGRSEPMSHFHRHAPSSHADLLFNPFHVHLQSAAVTSDLDACAR
ncbi:hypothetical protein IRJ41_023024 [Triplophysa rosa]|uniref:Uncharacterized protein n=1 Tax=Triplophysa rosa TaxID=992332 RepID=A0A9W7TXK6_TRIRA|nr:hypothetical protein IRJ41_023024 [Triplophysa rosa]